MQTKCGHCDEPIGFAGQDTETIEDIRARVIQIAAGGAVDPRQWIHVATGAAECAGLTATPDTPARYVEAIEDCWREIALRDARIRELEAAARPTD